MGPAGFANFIRTGSVCPANRTSARGSSLYPKPNRTTYWSATRMIRV